MQTPKPEYVELISQINERIIADKSIGPIWDAVHDSIRNMVAHAWVSTCEIVVFHPDRKEVSAYLLADEMIGRVLFIDPVKHAIIEGQLNQLDLPKLLEEVAILINVAREKA